MWSPFRCLAPTNLLLVDLTFKILDFGLQPLGERLGSRSTLDALHRRLVRNIRARAKERGIIITYLADHAGIGRSGFFSFMAGKNSPTLRWLAKIADALECDVTDLLRKRTE